MWVRNSKDRDLVPGCPRPINKHTLVDNTQDDTEMLNAVEELLRCPAVGTVVATPTKPLTLPQGCHLQLTPADVQEYGRPDPEGTRGILCGRDALGQTAASTVLDLDARPYIISPTAPMMSYDPLVRCRLSGSTCTTATAA